MPRRTIEERFWAKVQRRGPGECWEWQACLQPGGYGVLRIDGANQRAHRIAFFLAHGRWPAPLCCHHCDNRLCCNPAHLFEGTYADNHADMDRKGRRGIGERRGEANGNARLALADVQAIRQLHGRLSGPATAKRFGLGTSAIYRIWRGQAWTAHAA